MVTTKPTPSRARWRSGAVPQYTFVCPTVSHGGRQIWPNRTPCCLLRYRGAGRGRLIAETELDSDHGCGSLFPPSKPSVRPWCISSLMSANVGTTRACVRAWEREGCRDGTGTVMRHIQQAEACVPDKKTDRQTDSPPPLSASAEGACPHLLP